jgi:DNA polymerase, archaea type
MELQILDCDYVLVNNKPVIRLFCKNANGESICVFYDKFFPYFYLYGDESRYQEIIGIIKKKYPALKFEVVERFLPIGYSPKVKLIKITGTEPGQTPEIKEFAKMYGTPYEADILFRYRFMADFGLRGMSWIEVEGKFTKTSTVKCKALIADSIKPVEILKNAPLKYLSVDIECLPDEPRIPVPEKDKIIAVSLAFNPAYNGKERLVLLAKHARATGNVMTCPDEKGMLEKMKTIIDDYDPDIIAGYNINNFDLPYLLTRMEVLKVPRDLGRSEKMTITRKLQQTYMPNISGRIIVDAFEILKRDPWVKFKRYDLDTVSRQMLGDGKIKLQGNMLDRLKEIWNGPSQQELVVYAEKDSELVMRLLLEKRLMDKFFEIAKVCGLLLQDCLGGQSQRHEFRLLKEFYNRGFVMPCKPGSMDDKPGDHTLKGAFVLEPEVGFHEWIICLDFTSMYPSIIRAFNICTTTFMNNGETADHVVTPYGTKFVKPAVFKGVLPSLVDEFLSARAATKKQMYNETDPENKRILKAKNLALKDLSNSLYGYTGYPRSRLYVMDIANTITALGRDTIAKTKDLIEKNYPVKVIYADTDSVFIKATQAGQFNTLDEAEALGRGMAKFVSGNLPGMDLKFEKIYKTFLIEAKKRYAGWAFEKDNDKWVDKIDMKGIETVRRDWCTLVSQTMMDVLNTILKEKDIKKASRYVRTVILDLANGKVPLEKLSVVKGITKSIESYDGVQPHIELAKKIAQRDKTRSLIGERLEYVIVKGNQLLSKRAEDPDFVREKHLEIDADYYAQNQLLPPLERIFEVCGVSHSELLEGVKQKNLFDMLNGHKPQLSPDEVVLKGFENVVCKGCGWEFRRPSLSGTCPKCSSQLYFASFGNMGKTVDFSK